MPAKSSDVMSRELHDFVAYALTRLDSIRLSLKQSPCPSQPGQTVQQALPNPHSESCEKFEQRSAAPQPTTAQEAQVPAASPSHESSQNSIQNSNMLSTLQRIEAIKQRLSSRD